MKMIINKVSQNFVKIEPGEFMMGPSDNNHLEVIKKPFYMADTACTQEFWLKVMTFNPSYHKGDNLPVEQINWNVIQKFIKELNKLRPNYNFRLPTEAEWEYCCRAGTITDFNTGNTLSKKQANFDSDATVNVKSYPPNQWELYEMHGNVTEWCLIGKKNKYYDTGIIRLLKGGGFHFFATRSYKFTYVNNDDQYNSNSIGLRLVMEPKLDNIVKETSEWLKKCNVYKKPNSNQLKQEILSIISFSEKIETVAQEEHLDWMVERLIKKIN